MIKTISCIEDIKKLRGELARLRTCGIHSLYRGQSNKEWHISSTLRRCKGQKSVEELWHKYQSAFDCFCTKTEHFNWDKFKPDIENNKFYQLAIARHLGLPCNLLDWSASLDMAILMACIDFIDEDGCLFIILGRLNINQTPIIIDPLKENRSIFVCKDFDYIENGKSTNDLPLARKRRFNQNGFFSIISKKDIDSEFEDILPKDISMIRIPICHAAKNDIVNYLSDKGITPDYFFLPDCDSKQLQQLISDIKSKYF